MTEYCPHCEELVEPVFEITFGRTMSKCPDCDGDTYFSEDEYDLAAAEAAWERQQEEAWDRPTLDEQHRAAGEQKQALRR